MHLTIDLEETVMIEERITNLQLQNILHLE